MISAFEGQGKTYGPVRIHACCTYKQTVTCILYIQLDKNEEGRICTDQYLIHEKTVIVSGRIIFVTEFLLKGILHGDLRYDGEPIRGGSFDCVVLDYIEAQMVDDLWTRSRPIRSWRFDVDTFQEVEPVPVPIPGAECDNGPCPSPKNNNNNNNTQAPTAAVTGNGGLVVCSKSGVPMKRARGFYVHLTPRNLTLNKKFWKFFSRSVATVKITLQTKVRAKLSWGWGSNL
jgi:hypothetical protein